MQITHEVITRSSLFVYEQKQINEDTEVGFVSKTTWSTSTETNVAHCIQSYTSTNVYASTCMKSQLYTE